MPSHHAPPLSRGTESTGAVRRLVSDAQRETRALFREPEAVVRMTTPATADRPSGPTPQGTAAAPPAANPPAFPPDGPTDDGRAPDASSTSRRLGRLLARRLGIYG